MHHGLVKLMAGWDRAWILRAPFWRYLFGGWAILAAAIFVSQAIADAIVPGSFDLVSIVVSIFFVMVVTLPLARRRWRRVRAAKHPISSLTTGP